MYNLQYPFHLTAIPVLFIHFIILFSTFRLCLSSSHWFNSSNPLDLTASSSETRISSNTIHTHAYKPENRPQNFTMSELSVGEKCDIFTGSWVHDLSYPLYDSRTCPYLNGEVTCQSNGRPDSDYEKWRWQPGDCNIPRFNALYLLERLKGKTIMFVGDSLTNNQWLSMVCLLSSVLPHRRTVFFRGHPISTFKALDYGVSVSFQWAPYLVDMVSRVIGGLEKVVLQLDSVELSGRWWKKADILVFETGHWWGHNGRDARKWDYMQDGRNFYGDLDRMVAYRKALTTWANWIDSNIDFHITRVFFRSFSGAHLSARDWNNRSGRNCYGETEPILGSSYPGPYPPQLEISGGVVSRMKSGVPFLNITTLSLLRKDAHPSIYSLDLTAEQKKNPGRYADCSHWCLPGLPDTWNELLYSVLFF